MPEEANIDLSERDLYPGTESARQSIKKIVTALEEVEKFGYFSGFSVILHGSAVLGGREDMDDIDLLIVYDEVDDDLNDRLRRAWDGEEDAELLAKLSEMDDLQLSLFKSISESHNREYLKQKFGDRIDPQLKISVKLGDGKKEWSIQIDPINKQKLLDDLAQSTEANRQSMNGEVFENILAYESEHRMSDASPEDFNFFYLISDLQRLVEGREGDLNASRLKAFLGNSGARNLENANLVDACIDKLVADFESAGKMENADSIRVFREKITVGGDKFTEKVQPLSDIVGRVAEGMPSDYKKALLRRWDAYVRGVNFVQTVVNVGSHLIYGKEIVGENNNSIFDPKNIDREFLE